MKDTRINIRIPHAEKDLWESTAHIYGMTLTEFVTRSVRNNMLQLQQARNASNSSNSGGNVNLSYLSWESPSTQTS